MPLKAMRELPDYEMAPGSPDVLGWQVHDEADRPVGNVVDLMVDTQANQVPYLGVRLGNGQSVLVPIGSLDLDLDRGFIKVVDMTREQLADLPAYEAPTLSPEVEQRYYVLFHREEPVGAWEPSPPNYQLSHFQARTEGVRRLVQGLKPRSGAEKPGDRLGIFAASMPWDIAHLAPGPEAITEPEYPSEPLWQSEQPGFPAGLGTTAPKKPRPQS